MRHALITRAAGTATGMLSYMIRNRVWILAVGIAIVSDILDYFGGAVPVVGDVLDIVTSSLLYPVLGDVGTLMTLIELIPGADFLPTYTGVTLFMLWKRQQEEIEEMEEVPFNTDSDEADGSAEEE